jgi:hypothetical protein
MVHPCMMCGLLVGLHPERCYNLVQMPARRFISILQGAASSKIVLQDALQAFGSTAMLQSLHIFCRMRCRHLVPRPCCSRYIYSCCARTCNHRTIAASLGDISCCKHWALTTCCQCCYCSVYPCNRCSAYSCMKSPCGAPLPLKPPAAAAAACCCALLTLQQQRHNTGTARQQQRYVSTMCTCTVCGRGIADGTFMVQREISMLCTPVHDPSSHKQARLSRTICPTFNHTPHAQSATVNHTTAAHKPVVALLVSSHKSSQELT